MTDKVRREDFASGKQMAQAALALLLQAAEEASATRGRFVLGLSGGSTPAPLYQLLANVDADWSRWHLVYTDERCLPYGDPERNSTLVERNWLSHTDFPPGNHYLPELDKPPEQAAAAYAAAIAGLLPLDMALLGIGEDGHTASLFPSHDHPEQSVVAVRNAPKPPPDRISLSYSTLCAAKTVCYLVAGENKQAVVNAVLDGTDLPATRVRGAASTHLLVARETA